MGYAKFNTTQSCECVKADVVVAGVSPQVGVEGASAGSCQDRVPLAAGSSCVSPCPQGVSPPCWHRNPEQTK